MNITTLLKKLLMLGIGLALVGTGAVLGETQAVWSNNAGILTIVQGSGTPSAIHQIAAEHFRTTFPGMNIGLVSGCRTKQFRAVAYNPAYRFIVFARSDISQADANAKALGRPGIGTRLWIAGCGLDTGVNKMASVRLY